MTRIIYDPEELSMEIRGHAGYAEAGRDIVCAAVSALAMTLLEAASEPMYQSCRYVNRPEALIRVRCAPGKGYKSRCREMLRVIACGFELLALEYPEYVEMEVRE